MYNLKATFFVFQELERNQLIHTILLLLRSFFSSSLTQRCLIVIHLCAAILWIVNVLVFCASLCSVYWREQFGAGLEELVCVVDFLYMSLISMFYSFVFHIINHILAASSFCLCTSGWFFLFCFFFVFFSEWTVRESSLAFTSLNSTSHFLFWTCQMGIHSFCLDVSKDASKSWNVVHWALTSASTFKKTNRFVT